MKMAPPPSDPCLWIWEATRNCSLRHKSPWGEAAQVGMWRSWSPLTMSHTVIPTLILLSLHTTNASLPPLQSIFFSLIFPHFLSFSLVFSEVNSIYVYIYIQRCEAIHAEVGFGTMHMGAVTLVNYICGRDKRWQSNLHFLRTPCAL